MQPTRRIDSISRRARRATLLAAWPLCASLSSLPGCGGGAAADDGVSTGTTRLEGELAVYISEQSDGASALHYGLRLDRAREIRLELASPPDLASGTPVRIEGRFLDGDRFQALRLERVRSQSDTGTTRQAVILPPVTRRLGVLLLHYGQPLNLTREHYEQRIFGDPDSVKAYYADSSFGALDLTGDVFDWIQTEPTPTCDDPSGIRDRALAAAAAAEIDLSSYDHVLFVLADSCRGGGSADIGTPANPGRYSFYWASDWVPTFVHELGHNLGLQHSQVLDCGASILSAPSTLCTEIASVDPFDAMHNDPFSPQLHGYHKAQLGWLSDCNVVTAPAGGEFTLSPLEVGTSALQGLRIPAPSSVCWPAIGSTCYYFVEYRQPIGFDALPPFDTSLMHEGALVRITAPIDPVNFAGRSSQLLDMHPTPPLNDFWDARLAVGETFVDPTGIQLSVLSRTPEALRVRVTVPGGSGPALCLDGTDTCSDGVRDAWETDVDCGGGTCSACADGKLCGSGSDCQSGNCVDGTCASGGQCTSDAECDDHDFCNGAETCSAGACQPGTPWGAGCNSATPLARNQHSGNFGSSDERWYVVTDPLAGWQASNMQGRTIRVNGVILAPGQMPLPPRVDGKYYFHFSAGGVSWASWSFW